MCVWAGTITSSPLPRPNAKYTKCIPAVQDDTLIASLAFVNFLKRFSNLLVIGPCTKILLSNTFLIE